MNPEKQKQKMLRDSIAGIEETDIYERAFALIDWLKDADKKGVVLNLVYVIQAQQQIIGYLDSVCPDEEEPPVFYPMSTPARRR